MHKYIFSDNNFIIVIQIFMVTFRIYLVIHQLNLDYWLKKRRLVVE